MTFATICYALAAIIYAVLAYQSDDTRVKCPWYGAAILFALSSFFTWSE